jgi:hypothetical protein
VLPSGRGLFGRDPWGLRRGGDESGGFNDSDPHLKRPDAAVRLRADLEDAVDDAVSGYVMSHDEEWTLVVSFRHH